MNTSVGLNFDYNSCLGQILKSTESQLREAFERIMFQFPRNESLLILCGRAPLQKVENTIPKVHVHFGLFLLQSVLKVWK